MCVPAADCRLRPVTGAQVPKRHADSYLWDGERAAELVIVNVYPDRLVAALVCIFCALSFTFTD